MVEIVGEINGLGAMAGAVAPELFCEGFNIGNVD